MYSIKYLSHEVYPSFKTPSFVTNVFKYNNIPESGLPREYLGPKAKGTTPPPNLQIMILKLSPQWCVISNESVQQKWIDELWIRKQLSTCLFVWTLNYNDLVHLLNSWAPVDPLSVGLSWMNKGYNYIHVQRSSLKL